MNGTSLGALSSRELIRKRNEFQLLLQDPYNALPPRTTVGRMIEEESPDPWQYQARRFAKAGDRGDGRSRSRRRAGHDQLPNALSTGERQRISIARALILDPKLLILDETLSALDQREQGRLIELFSKLQEKNDLTYVFISHDLAMVRKVCTRIAVMYLGEMVEIADNRDLFFDPQHPYTKALLSAAPTLEQSRLIPPISCWRASRPARSTSRRVAALRRAVRRHSAVAGWRRRGSSSTRRAAGLPPDGHQSVGKASLVR